MGSGEGGEKEAAAHRAEVLYVYTPSLVGSLAFCFASYIFLVEASHTFNPFQPPGTTSTLGYLVALRNDEVRVRRARLRRGGPHLG